MIEKETRMPSLLSKLKRETSSGSYIPALDGLRFLAIASVFYFHIGSTMQGYLTSLRPQSFVAQTVQVGERGVSLFFLISGFILGLPFAAQRLSGGKRIRLQDFYLRRLTRLEPPFILCLILCLGLGIVRLHKPISYLLPHFFANLTYTHTLIYHAFSQLNPVLWSLEVEAQFYLLMPVFAMIYSVRGVVQRRTLLVAIVMGVMFAYPHIFAADNTWARFTALFSLPCFLLGMLLSDIYVPHWKEKPISSNAGDLLAVLCLLTMFGVRENIEADRLLMPWVQCLLMASVLCGNATKRIASIPALCTIGGMCYSIYLFHYELIVVISYASFKVAVGRQFLPNFIVQSIIMTPIVLGLCTLYFLFVEKPCMARDLPQRIKAKFTKSVPSLQE